VRSLLVFVALASVLASCLAMMRNRYEQELQTACELERALPLVAVRDGDREGVLRRLFGRASGRDYRPVTELRPVWRNQAQGGPWTDEDQLASIRHLRNLRKIFIGGGGITDEAIGHLGELPNLESIGIYGEHIRGTAFRHWSALTKLRIVFLAGTSVDDTTLGYLKDVESLEELTIEGRATRISDAGLRELRGFSNLKSLGLGNLQITDKGLLHLKGTPRLQVVYLVANQNVSQEGIDALQAAMPHLTISVDLAGKPVP
jgi:Leucine-rich repeat (LRR) protein